MAQTIISAINTIFEMLGNLVGIITSNWILMTLLMMSLIGSGIAIVIRLIKAKASRRA